MGASLRRFMSRPLSGIAALAAGLVIVYEVVRISQGELYEKPLGSIDRTTLIQLGIMALWGLVALRDRSDLEAVSFTLVGGLSFIFAYEAVYKWSFYLTPFGQDMPSNELRQLVIQLGTALTILTGFASGVFRVTRWTAMWGGVFILLWSVWLLAGFPQITDKVVWSPVLPVHFGYSESYLINRLTKVALWLCYLTLFPRFGNGERGKQRGRISHSQNLLD